MLPQPDWHRSKRSRPSSMHLALLLHAVCLQGMGPKGIRIQAPPQVEVPEGTTLQQAQQLLQAAGMHFPLLVKPLWTDGREGSHGLAVLHDTDSLQQVLSGQVPSELQPPLVVQQFVQHGGVLFKVSQASHIHW